jgi:deazaflavin-dependent oxidoreductase (nitroreductase family)
VAQRPQAGCRVHASVAKHLSATTPADAWIVADPIVPFAPAAVLKALAPGNKSERGHGGGRAVVSHGGRMAHVAEHYRRRGWFTTNVFNRVVALLTRLGVSVYGSRVLEVRGRKSGEWRQTPVNLLRYEGAEYLVSPRGQTQWVKNLGASGQGRLRVGRRAQSFHAVELADDEKPPLLRAYLRKWKFEVGVFLPVLDPTLQTRNCATSRPIIQSSA